MTLQQETTLTIQDSWYLRSLLAAQQNKKSLKPDSAGPVLCLNEYLFVFLSFIGGQMAKQPGVCDLAGWLMSWLARINYLLRKTSSGYTGTGTAPGSKTLTHTALLSAVTLHVHILLQSRFFPHFWCLRMTGQRLPGHPASTQASRK